ncbi:YncE family protein [Acidianus sp. HS-5]|uniref:YncE family protein n=1 Tax=Acidianus sp. HS-5 TaxID=2886040 RepID=UPI001F473CA3|nr:YncE family protein [Acidianus sp. HS-5]BDC17568.1 hypothetical protein HS5_04580 [Acidianus sp. HS-5]
MIEDYKVRKIAVANLIILVTLLVSITTPAILFIGHADTTTSNGQSIAGYVKYTLLLYDNVLIDGNYNGTYLGIGPSGIAYDPNNGYFYVADSASCNVSVIDPVNNSVLDTIRVGFGPYGVVYEPYVKYIYVTDYESCTVTVINPYLRNELVCTINVGPGPYGIAYIPPGTPLGGYYGSLIITHYGSVVQGTTTITWIFNIGLSPAAGTSGTTDLGIIPCSLGIFYDPSNNLIYVTDFGNNTLTVIGSSFSSGLYVKAIIGVGSGPYAIAQDPTDGYLYVTNSRSNTVSVIDPINNSVIDSIKVGLDPHGVAYDPSNGYIYVADYGSNALSVIEPMNNSVIATIQVGSNPCQIAYDPNNGYLYVTDRGSGSISVISTVVPSVAYQITFTESGLPPGTLWSVTLNGITETSKTNTITFNEPNGVYEYTVTPFQDYTVSPSSGKITVSNSNVIQQIVFTQVSTGQTSTSTSTQSTPSSTSTLPITRTSTSQTSTSSSQPAVIPNITTITGVSITYILLGAMMIIILLLVVIMILVLRRH